MKTKWVTLNKFSARDIYYVLIMDIEWYVAERHNLDPWFDQNAPNSKPKNDEYLIAFTQDEWTNWRLTWG